MSEIVKIEWPRMLFGCIIPNTQSTPYTPSRLSQPWTKVEKDFFDLGYSGPKKALSHINAKISSTSLPLPSTPAVKMVSARVITNLIPSLLIPPAVIPSMNIGCILLFLSLYTLPIQTRGATVARVFFGALSLPFFWDLSFGTYGMQNLSVAMGVSCFGIYGLMVALEACFVGLWDSAPPFWVKSGQPVALPTTVSGRALYALDLLTSIRGASWLKDTAWNWAVPTVTLDTSALASGSKPRITRARFLQKTLLSLSLQYIAVDFFDTINHIRKWSPEVQHPITTLPILQQLVFSFSVCACTALSITIPAAVYPLILVPLGSDPSSWQTPLFNHPFAASSLQDFWSNRWHALWKHVFDRLSSIFLYFIPSSTPVGLRKVVRASVIFGLCALFHLLLLWRTVILPNPDPSGAPIIRERSPLFNSSTLKFFLSQPFGLLLERTVVFPITHAMPGPVRMTLRRVWAWAWLLWSGRWWSDAWVHHGFWNETEMYVGWSLVRGVWRGQWLL